VKHIFYRWNDGARGSVSIADNLQLPQFDIRGYKVEDKLEILTTGKLIIIIIIFSCYKSLKMHFKNESAHYYYNSFI